MAGQFSLNTNQLEQFAPNSPILAFRPTDSGSPQQDWCKHLDKNPVYRRELEEFAVLGDVVVRINDGIEAAPVERVKILSLEYAMKVLKDETDAKEFVRAARAIASSDAGQFELEQIAAFYYGEIRRGSGRAVNEVLKEMALLGMQMEAVTATIAEREIKFFETSAPEQKLTIADERRIRAARENRKPLPKPTPNFDDEMTFIKKRIGRAKIANNRRDEFEEYFLEDAGKTLEELDADYAAFERFEQYDENGIVAFAMSGGQHAVVVYDFESEVDASYLPQDARFLAKEMSFAFVGHALGGSAAQRSRRFVCEQKAINNELNLAKRGYVATVSTAVPSLDKFSALPLAEDEFSEWLAAQLDRIYCRRAARTARRRTHLKNGQEVEYEMTQEINPDYEEMQYVGGICRILWSQMNSDFHLRNLRRKAYQTLYLDIRRSTDTAEVARLKKAAYDLFKDEKKLSLKEFTALNTVSKAQEARLADRISPATRKLLAEITGASQNRVRYFKFFLYNDPTVKASTRQEKQRLWDAVRARETALKATEIQNTSGRQSAQVQAHQQPLFQRQTAQKQIVRVAPQQSN